MLDLIMINNLLKRIITLNLTTREAIIFTYIIYRGDY